MRKVVALFLDGGTWAVINPLLKEGKLPAFAKLIEQGSRAVLKSTIPPLSYFAWSSILTGKGAGKHGIYNFYSFDKENNLKFNQGSNDPNLNKFLWDFLTEKGISPIFFEVPITYPPRKLDGVMISYDPPNLQTDFTFPKDYKEKLLKQFPDYGPEILDRVGEDETSKRKLFKKIQNYAEAKFKVIDYLMENEKWDFFITDLKVTDSVQHWFWKNVDKSHPYYSKDFSSDYVNKIYQSIDCYLNRLMAKLPEDTIFIIASDHGFGKYMQDINMNKWLESQGYLVFKKSTSFFKKYLKKIGFTPSNISQILLKLKLGFLFKYFMTKTMENVIHKLSLSYQNMDMSKTIAYSYGYCGPIYLNKNLLGSKYDEVREEIINKLKLIKDPIYNKKLISETWKKEELYPGSRNEGLPDIIINMQDFSYGCSSSFAFKSDKLFSKPITSKSGDHKVEGFFIISGKGIKKEKKSLTLNLVDFLPTLLYLYNCEIPKNLDGKPISELFDKNFKLIK